MKTQIFSKIFLVSILWSITQCGSLQIGGKYDKEKVARVKSIAVVGFTADAPLDTGSHMASALLGKEETAPGTMHTKMGNGEGESGYSIVVYDDVVKSLQKVGWKVKNATEVQSAPSIKAFNARSVKMGYLPQATGTGRFERFGIPQYAHAAALAGKGELTKFAKDLGVNAVAVVYVQAKGSQSIPLVTKINHSASVMIQIYDPTTEEMIMNFASNGEEIQGTTKTKIGKDFLDDVQKGTVASIAKFQTDLSKRLKE
jgi:hypothetical protein